MRQHWRHFVGLSLVGIVFASAAYVGCSSFDDSGTGKAMSKVTYGQSCSCATDLSDLALHSDSTGATNGGVLVCTKNPTDPSVCMYTTSCTAGFYCGGTDAPGFSPSCKDSKGNTLYCCGGVLFSTNVCSVDASVPDTSSDTGADGGTPTDVGADSSGDAATDAAEVASDASDAADAPADGADASSDGGVDALIDSGLVDSAPTDTGAADATTDSTVTDSGAADAADSAVADTADGGTDATVTDSTVTDGATDSIADVTDSGIFFPDGAVCSSDAGTPAAPTTGIAIRWDQPSGYTTTSAVVEGWYSGLSGWGALCTMTSSSGCGYTCPLTPPSGATLRFTIHLADPLCVSTMSRWVFDESPIASCGGGGQPFGNAYVGFGGTWYQCNSLTSGPRCTLEPNTSGAPYYNAVVTGLP